MKHLKGLDGIRALSVLLVVVAHSGYQNIVPGGFGVTVFFFLSGFLITTLLQREYENKSTISYSNFMMRRCLRIFIPLYFVYLSLILLSQLNLYLAEYSLNGVLSQLFFVTNYFKIYGNPEELLNGTGVFWSLAVEEHFYIIFPLIFLFLIRRNLSYLFWFSVLMCVLILIWRLYLNSYIDNPSRFYLATDTRFDSILYGVLLSLYMFKNNLFNESLERLVVRDYVVIIVAILIIVFTFLYRDSMFRNTFRYSLQGLALIPLFYYVVTRPDLTWFSWLNSHVLIKIGLYSYFIYLIHFPIIIMFQHYLKIQDGLLLFTMVFVSSYFLAVQSYRYIERPIQRYKNKFN